MQLRRPCPCSCGAPKARGGIRHYWVSLRRGSFGASRPPAAHVGGGFQKSRGPARPTAAAAAMLSASRLPLLLPRVAPAPPTRPAQVSSLRDRWGGTRSGRWGPVGREAGGASRGTGTGEDTAGSEAWSVPGEDTAGL